MLVFSRGSLGAAPTDPLDPLAHPAASVTIATADAMIAFRDFISLQMSMDGVACDRGVGLKASRDILAPAHCRLPVNLDLPAWAAAGPA
jgi:hypothetical protein